MSEAIVVPIIVGLFALVNMFLTVFGIQWMRTRDESRKADAVTLAADLKERAAVLAAELQHRVEKAEQERTSEAAGLRTDRESMRKETREDIAGLRAELNAEREENRKLRDDLRRLEGRIDVQDSIIASQTADLERKDKLIEKLREQIAHGPAPVHDLNINLHTKNGE